MFETHPQDKWTGLIGLSGAYQVDEAVRPSKLALLVVQGLAFVAPKMPLTPGLDDVCWSDPSLKQQRDVIPKLINLLGWNETNHQVVGCNRNCIPFLWSVRVSRCICELHNPFSGPPTFNIFFRCWFHPSDFSPKIWGNRPLTPNSSSAMRKLWGPGRRIPWWVVASGLDETVVQKTIGIYWGYILRDIKGIVE